ncbi:MAG TPA: hypothetical protein DGO89_10655 [Microcoleaceae bacterium UBA9251]|nr:hypothetical protein [Microcoleaceae cyanobacterium UBA11344]HCV30626.1 hypothetical protein [Microcoleaceae cyanobacterium UBA9251]
MPASVAYLFDRITVVCSPKTRQVRGIYMRGTVLSFSIQANQGFISGDDGKRYNFLGSDWNLSNTPTQGVKVDFEVDGNRATSFMKIPVPQFQIKL